MPGLIYLFVDLSHCYLLNLLPDCILGWWARADSLCPKCLMKESTFKGKSACSAVCSWLFTKTFRTYLVGVTGRICGCECGPLCPASSSIRLEFYHFLEADSFKNSAHCKEQAILGTQDISVKWKHKSANGVYRWDQTGSKSYLLCSRTGSWLAAKLGLKLDLSVPNLLMQCSTFCFLMYNLVLHFKNLKKHSNQI